MTSQEMRQSLRLFEALEILIFFVYAASMVANCFLFYNILFSTSSAIIEINLRPYFLLNIFFIENREISSILYTVFEIHDFFIENNDLRIIGNYLIFN